MPGFDHFDWIAPYYERLIRAVPDGGWDARLGLPVNGLVLDAGGGTGRVARWLAPKTGGVIVADASMPMLVQARQVHGLAVACCETERLPFSTGSFECVIMVDALHHVSHHQQTAHELLRVLQAGGILVIEEPDLDTFWAKAIAVAEKLLLMRSHFLSAEQIQALFRGCPVEVQIERSGTNTWVTVRKLV